MEKGEGTSVNSHHQLTLGNLLRQVMDLLSPCWAYNKLIFSYCLPDTVTLVTGTVICPIYGNKVKLCLQENTKSVPLVLVELPLSTRGFTSSIQYGVLRVVLEPVHGPGSSQGWVTYCNGQKVGFARRLEMGEEKLVLDMMQMVSAGAGIMLHRGTETGGYKYLRGQFERVVGSDDTESYHLTDPSNCFGQEFSIFFLGN
ncbi:PREDICTED: protein MIZU-KUSSEI 1 [Theobroma cacao]|uniref:Protein MIZU-KUSSEI 1 n=1 Tax=Theobroma cacao TaxID=3641 RepID=A0AB32VMJ8_THECC|nr:PREDICTED: protein MIZU-KUSSEI 1 [Theobroma cacao]